MVPSFPKTRSWIIPLLAILGVNLWSCWPVFRWPFNSSDAAVFSILITKPNHFLDKFLFHLETIRDGWQPMIAALDAWMVVFFGVEPWPYRLVGFLLYTSWGLAAFLLTRLLTGSAAMGLGTGLLLAFLPTRITTDLGYFECHTACEATFGCLFLYWTARGILQNSRISIGCGLICLSLTLLFRQASGIFLPVFICTMLFLKKTDRIPKNSHKRLWIATLLATGIVLSHLWIRLELIGNRALEHASYVTHPTWENLPTLLKNGTLAYLYAPAWILKAYQGFHSILAQTQRPWDALKLLWMATVLAISALTLFSAPAPTPEHWPKRLPWVLLLSLTFYLVGLAPTCFIRTPPPGLEGRLDVWGSMQELYRPLLAFLGLAWMIVGILSTWPPAPSRSVCLTLLLYLFLLDSSYFRRPRLSPYADYGYEIETSAAFGNYMKKLPDGIRIVTWDTLEKTNPQDIYAIKTVYLTQTKLLGHSRRWSVEYLGRFPGAVSSSPKWKDITASHTADVFLWHERKGSNLGFIYDEGSIQAYFPKTQTLAEILAFRKI